jgi:SAM-dependent methyltransferase
MASLRPEPSASQEPSQIACPLCASTRTARAYSEHPLLERCGACGLVWRREPPVRGLYDESFFTESGYYAAYFERAAQWRHEARLRLAWALQFRRPARLLEVGSAGGFFLEAARRAGIDVLGIEPSEDGARFARDQLGVPVLTGSFEEVEIAESFDAVCAFHVLEHVHQPHDFLARARASLTPDGQLALEVPNIESARAHQDGAHWFNLVPDYHRWHFSPTTLARLVEGAGFAVESVDTVYPRHYFRLRRIFTVSGLRTILADVRCNPTPHRAHPTAGDYLRLLARPR